MKNLSSALTAVFSMFFFRYNEDLELEDAIHTAILTLKVSSVSTDGFKKDSFSNELLVKLTISYLPQLGKFRRANDRR